MQRRGRITPDRRQGWYLKVILTSLWPRICLYAAGLTQEVPFKVSTARPRNLPGRSGSVVVLAAIPNVHARKSIRVGSSGATPAINHFSRSL